MDVGALEAGYQAVIALGEQCEFAAPDDGWTASMVFAHLTVNDHLLMSGIRDGRYDNSQAVDETRLRSEPSPLTSLRQSSRALVALAGGLSDAEAAAEIAVLISDGGVVRVDQPMSVGRLLQIYTDVHLPSHREQLESLRR
jgi:hypothetical protein